MKIRNVALKNNFRDISAHSTSAELLLTMSNGLAECIAAEPQLPSHRYSASLHLIALRVTYPNYCFDEGAISASRAGTIIIYLNKIILIKFNFLVAFSKRVIDVGRVMCTSWSPPPT